MRALAAAVLVTIVYVQYRGGAWHPAFARDGVPAAYPLAEMSQPDPELLRAIRATSGALLELPLGANGTAPTPHAQAMYRSIHHWRPLLNGYSSYFPAQFREHMALAARLPDPRAVAALRAATGVAMVLVRWDHLTPPERERWQVAVAAPPSDGSLERVLSTRDGVLFRIR